MLNPENTSGEFFASPDGQLSQARFSSTQSTDEVVLAFQSLRNIFSARKRSAAKAARASSAAVSFAASR